MSGDPQTLREILLARVEADPDRLAYDDGERRLTNRELLDAAAAKAARMAELGVRPRDRVALVLPAGIGFVEAFWAVHLLGAASCAFNPMTAEAALSRRVARVRPRLVVTEGLLDGAPAAEVGPDPGIGRDDAAFLQTTSGTSGEPRAAIVLHRNVIAYALRGCVGPFQRVDVVVAWVPPWHDFGLVRFLISSVCHGVPCHVVQPAVTTIPLWLETMSRVRATVSGAPDFAFRLATRMVDPSTVDLSSLRILNNGAEPVRASTIEAFEQRFGLDRVVAPGYGLAEATLGVASHPTGEPIVVDDRGNVSCGVPRPGVEVRIEAAPGGPGEILVRSDYVFAGYFDAPEETAETLRDGWLHTGDLGYLDDAGRLFVLGRKRAMIKRAGAVIAPRELEEVAHEVEGVRLAAALAVPDERDTSDDRVVVVVEPMQEGAGASLPHEVSRAIAAQLGFAPSEVVVAPRRTIPRTENGKIRYDSLRALLLDDRVTRAA